MAKSFAPLDKSVEIARAVIAETGCSAVLDDSRLGALDLVFVYEAAERNDWLGIPHDAHDQLNER